MSGGNENKSYVQRSAANSRYDKVYTAFVNGLQLSQEHRIELHSRGLTDEQIKDAEYVSKPDNRGADLQRTVASLNVAYDLKGVPGFFLDGNNRRTIINTAGLIIPIRDHLTQIQSLLIKPQKPKQGRKYELLSTPKSTEGGGARNTTHVPVTHKFKSKQEIGSTVRITEGVLKADVACALDPRILTLGLPGLNAPDDLKWLLEELEISKVILAFDNEKTTDVHDRKKKLYNALCEDFDVTFELWNPEHKGIDDALLRDPTSIHLLPKEDIPKHISEIENPALHWVYVVRMEAFYCLKYDDILSKSQFVSKMRLASMEVLNHMIAGISSFDPFPQVDEVEFAPAEEQQFMRGEKTYLNTWRPNPVQPSEGDVSPFLNHVEYLFPTENERISLLQWIAHQVQHPGVKIHFAALIRGKPGIGKSFLGYLMDFLLGRHNVSRPSNNDIHEDFSPWEKNCQLVVVEEVMAEGRVKLMNDLKPKITEPITRVREMYKSSYEQPNRYNMMLLTNYKNSLPIEEDDRRYMVLFSPAEPRDPGYYRDLFEWSKLPESASALLYWALTYSLAGFEAKGHAPKTVGREEMVDLSKAPFEQFVETCLEEKLWPFNSDIVSIHDIANSKELPPKFRGNGSKKWTSFLSTLGAESLGQIEIVAGQGKRHVWAVRRAEFWKLQSLKDKQKEYGKWQDTGTIQPGGSIVDDHNFPMSA